MEKSSNAAAADKTAAASPSEQFPLFFVKPVALDLEHHAKAGLAPTKDFSFAAKTNSILVNCIEFVEAAKHYPIVFTEGEQPLPAVILGLESANYFVDKKQQWKEGAYIPAYVRKYPFVFMEMAKPKQFLLCVDEGAPQFKKTGGKDVLPFYDGNEPSSFSRQALEFCTAFHNHYVTTLQFCKELQDAGLLMPSQSNAKLSNGREINLAGFQMIDEKKLNALPDDKIVEFHKKGWLPLIYFALMSASHWQMLAQMAGKRES